MTPNDGSSTLIPPGCVKEVVPPTTTGSTTGEKIQPMVFLPHSYGDFVAVETFKTKVVEKEIKSGFAKAKQRVTLAPLKILYGNDKHGLWAGMIVYVRGDYAYEGQASETFEIEEGKPFFLLPISQIKLVKLGG